MDKPFVKVGDHYIGIANIVEIFEISGSDVLYVFSVPTSGEGEAWEIKFTGQEAEDLRNWLRHHSDDVSDDYYKPRCQAAMGEFNCNKIVANPGDRCPAHMEANHETS